MTERISSGTARLDAVLHGGLPRNAISMVIGLPGSGKTILAQQWVYHNAEAEAPALYLSTVSEPLEKILRFGQALSFFDPSAVGSRVFYEDLGSVLADRGLAGVLDRVRELIYQHRPGIIVIDSFKALRPYADGEGGFRQFLHVLAGTLSAYPVTSLWIGEYEQSDVASLPEFAVADAILAMGTGHIGERAARWMEVLKLRGGDFRSGRHAYRIGANGVTVYPRLADPGDDASYYLDRQRISSGVQALDDMLSDGYWPGASTLVAGPTGAGKTLMGLHFVFGGARHGERGVIATLQEDPTQLERIARSYGWSLTDDKITLMYRSPIDLYVDEWVHELYDLIEETGATRVLVDSLGDLQMASTDLNRFREYTYSLLHHCARLGVSVMLTYEVPDLFGISRLTEYGASHLADNVVLLQYRNVHDSVSRTLTVLKTRASSHDPHVRDFRIDPDGIALADHQPGPVRVDDARSPRFAGPDDG